MNSKQRQFIREKLIPFIQRDGGLGFSMSHWVAYDPRPACQTAACIGGSLDILLFKKKRSKTDAELTDKVKEATGLSPMQQHGLFYSYHPDSHLYSNFGWPQDMAIKYIKALPDKEKAADVAVELMELVMRTNGRCLRYAKNSRS